MFKLREFESVAEKTAAAREVVKHLDQLPLQIDLIRRYEAGIDVRKLDWSNDVVLVMDFDNMKDLDAYTIHPKHQEFVAFNKAFSVAKTCIDYEL